MSYLGTVNLIKNISEAVNPTGLFLHSNKWTASLNFDSVDKQVYLYPISAGVDLANHYYESWTITMGFYFQDAQDSNPLDQQGLVSVADNMVTEFLSILNDTEGVELSGARKEPSYRQMAGTYTGMILSFTLGATTDICGASIVYPDLPNYPSLRPYSELWDLNEGETVINHGLEKNAKFVTFLVTETETVFDWRNSDKNNIIVTSTVAAMQVRINIISYEL